MGHPGQTSLGLTCTIIVAAIVIAGLVSWLSSPVTKLLRYFYAVITRTVDQHREYCQKHGQE